MSIIEFDLLDNLTGGDSLSIQLASNGTDTIYWCHTGTTADVYQYKIGVGTTNLGTPGDYPAVRGAGLVYFKGNLYQMRHNADISNVKIYKWNGAVWSTSYTPQYAPSQWLATPGLWASDNLMVAIIPGDFDPVPDPDDIGRLCVWSTTGAGWTQGTVNGATDTFLYGVFYRGAQMAYPGRRNSVNVGEVYAELTLTNNNASDGRSRIFKFDEATKNWVALTGDFGYDDAPPKSPNDSIRYLCAAPDRHWKIDGGNYSYTSNFSSWTASPDGGTIQPIYQLGIPYTCAYYRLPVANTNYVYAWFDDEARWVQTAFHGQQPTYGDPFAVINLNGIMYLLTKSATQNRILGAHAVPLTCDGTNRLWIYTIASSGITSRGVVVIPPS